VQASSKRKIERRIKRGIDCEYNGFGHVGEYLTSPLAHTHVQKKIFFFCFENSKNGFDHVHCHKSPPIIRVLSY
jgi:hypothetical protein